MKVDTQTLQEGSTNWGFHSRGVLWDTLVTRWAGEENDRVQWMARHPLRKDDVIVALMNMLRHPTTHLDKNPRGIPSKKLRDLDLRGTRVADEH